MSFNSAQLHDDSVLKLLHDYSQTASPTGCNMDDDFFPEV